MSSIYKFPFFALTTACGGIQAYTSATDFRQGPYKTYFASPISTNVSKANDHLVKISSQKVTSSGLELRFEATPLCETKRHYLEQKKSTRSGKGIVGSDLFTAQLYGWGIDFLTVGGLYGWTLSQPTESNQTQTALTIAATASILVINSLGIRTALKAQRKQQQREETAYRPCDKTYTTAEQLTIAARAADSDVLISKEKAKWVVPISELGSLYLGSLRTNAKLEFEVYALPQEFVSQYVETIPYELTEEQLDIAVCEAIKTTKGIDTIGNLKPQVAFKLGDKISCRSKAVEVICEAAKSHLSTATFNTEQNFSNATGWKVGLYDLKQYQKNCQLNKDWSATFQRSFEQQIKQKEKVGKLQEIIDTHDAFLPISYSGLLKRKLVDYAYSYPMDKMHIKERIATWTSLMKYIDDSGLAKKYQRTAKNNLQKKLKVEFKRCTALWPSPHMPCMGAYLNYISNDTPDVEYQLLENFQKCTENDMQIAQSCVLPLYEQTNIWGNEWKNQIFKVLRKEALNTATKMLAVDDVPTKKINQTLIYLESWSPHLGTTWKKAFIDKTILQIINELIESNLQNADQRGYTNALRIVKNYRYLFDDQWAERHLKIIQQGESSYQRETNQQISADPDPTCITWRYPNTPLCSNQYKNQTECSKVPTIDVTRFPKCTPKREKPCNCK